jgi:hypothetical protein
MGQWCITDSVIYGAPKFSTEQTKLQSNLWLCSPHLISNFCCFYWTVVIKRQIKVYDHDKKLEK